MTGLNQKLWNYKGHGEAIGFDTTEFKYDSSKLVNSKINILVGIKSY